MGVQFLDQSWTFDDPLGPFWLCYSKVIIIVAIVIVVDMIILETLPFSVPLFIRFPCIFLNKIEPKSIQGTAESSRRTGRLTMRRIELIKEAKVLNLQDILRIGCFGG